jgi:hypothetical protein
MGEVWWEMIDKDIKKGRSMEADALKLHCKSIVPHYMQVVDSLRLNSQMGVPSSQQAVKREQRQTYTASEQAETEIPLSAHLTFYSQTQHLAVIFGYAPV